MANRYPSAIKTFLVAENLRQEVGGKVTIMGALGGSRLNLPQDAVFPAGFPIAFYFVFEGGEGEFDIRISIRDPGGKPLLEAAQVGKLKQAPNQALQVLVNFGMFVVPSVGDYTVEIMLDKQVYAESFNVGVDPNPPVTAT